MRILLSGDIAALAGQDRLANNEDYGPYGQPENMPVEEAAFASLTRAERAGSTETLSDESETGPLECPSLGA